MAIDNTPPRLRLIATIGFIVVVTLIGLDFVFKSYYAFMSDEAQREKIAPRADLAAQVAAEQKAFAGAKIPLDQAMAQLAKGERGDVTPQASDDMGPMTGWSKMPKPLPYPTTPHAAPSTDPHAAADAGAPTAAGDAGPAIADAGPAAAADAGAAPHAPAPAPHADDAGAHPPRH
ncbi:MAG: hypothetical protein KF819_28500 [Labilithrix sp.]|nr:hypothetical protein [Labilithrix sp.]